MCLLLSGCEPGKPAKTPSSTDPLARERGRILFREKCALCHGDHADGRGVRASNFDRKPADFSSGAWREGASASGVAQAIRDGLRGTPMPAWPLLDQQDVRDLTVYVLSVSELGP